MSAIDPEDKFDAVVIGSGFGGAAAAHRLAEESVKSILVLERGMPYPPGSFPRTPWEWRENVWDPPGHHGLFELLNFPKATAVVSSGLGGGSLIYANVLLEKPPETFAADQANGWREWPVSYDDLAAGYAAVRRQLRPAGVPYDLPKRAAFEQALKDDGLKPEPAPVAITFSQRDGEPPQLGMPLLDDSGAIDSDNLHHRPRRTCTLVGECDFGCNVGAKNTLDFTFLSRFMRHPGGRREIRTCCEAIRIVGPISGGGYVVHYRQHTDARKQVETRADDEKQETDKRLLDRAKEGDRTVYGKVLVLAAGTFGSTRLLLASRATLPSLSRQLGHGFSSNGDLLKFARHCRDHRGQWRRLAPSRGPVITTYARRDDEGHQVWLEDGGYPRGMEMTWQLTETPRDLWDMRGLALTRLRGRPLGNVGGQYVRALGSAEASGAMLPLLAMGRDVRGGRLHLRGDSLMLDWDPDADSAPYFEFAQGQTDRIAKRLGGRLAGALWRRHGLFGPGLTAHPLGGCPMGKNAPEGVVDRTGQVFGCDGLYVADGSMMPGAIGPNPSFTIAALAHLIGGEAAKKAK